MTVETQPATVEDLADLVRLYRELEGEQVALKRLWQLADGLAEPVEASFKEILEEPQSVLNLGLIDEVAVGFIYGRVEELLPQASGQVVGVIHLVFTEFDARGVGVGEAMLHGVLDDFRSRGISLFDARVLPGHRHAKNFFEAAGFSARLIIMHHED